MFQTTGTVRVVAVGSTGTVTWTTAGSVTSPSIGAPVASTATGCTLVTRSVAASPKRTVAYTAAIRAMRLAAPLTRTSLGFSAVSPGRFPDGGSLAKRTCTPAGREVIGSTRTLIVDGVISVTRTSGFATVTWTGRSCASVR